MTNLFLAGAGALGSQLAFKFARPDLSFTILDDDRVERANIESVTTCYTRQHLNVYKAIALSEILARRGMQTRALVKRLDQSNAPILIKNASLVIDCFDNEEARFHLSIAALHLKIPLLHLGVSNEQTGLITWGRGYPLNSNPEPRGENPVCTHLLGRGILDLTASIGGFVLGHWLETGEQWSYWTRVFQGKPELACYKFEFVTG